MSKLIRMDRTGHTTLAEWTATDDAARARAEELFAAELENGMLASATSAGGQAEVVRELPPDAAAARRA